MTDNSAPAEDDRDANTSDGEPEDTDEVVSMYDQSSGSSTKAPRCTRWRSARPFNRFQARIFSPCFRYRTAVTGRT